MLELILGNEHCDFGDVPAQLHTPLQLTHLHLCLHRSRALNGTDQHQLTRQTVWALDREMAPRQLSSQQGEAKRVAHWSQGRDPEHDTRGWQVGHHRHVVVGEGSRGLRTGLVVHGTGVTFTTPAERKTKTFSPLKTASRTFWNYSLWFISVLMKYNLTDLACDAKPWWFLMQFKSELNWIANIQQMIFYLPLGLFLLQFYYLWMRINLNYLCNIYLSVFLAFTDMSF